MGLATPSSKGYSLRLFLPSVPPPPAQGLLTLRSEGSTSAFFPPVLFLTGGHPSLHTPPVHPVLSWHLVFRRTNTSGAGAEGFGDRPLSVWQAKGTDTLLSGMWGMESPWHKAVAQLLKDSTVATWEKDFDHLVMTEAFI